MTVQRFIVAGMQRSGTTVTHVCLQGHPNVTMAVDEVYVEPFYTRGLATFTGGKESFQTRKRGMSMLFDTLIAAAFPEPAPARGIKTAIGNHGNAIAFTNCLREFFPDVRVILVSREDLVAQYGSLVRAERSGEWHRTERSKSTFDATIHLDADAFTQYADDALHAMSQLRTLHDTHVVHEFSYERDILPGTGYEALFEFLGIPVMPPKWLRMSKVAPPPESFITNYAKLRQRQARLPIPDVEQERELARSVLRESATSESQTFLLTRALERIEQGRAEDAVIDVMDSARSDKSSGEYWLRGTVFAALEAVDQGVVRESGAFDVLTREGADTNPAFLLNRARVRDQDARYLDAIDDAVAALRRGLDPRGEQATHAFHLLESGLGALGAVDRAKQIVDEFASAYEDCGRYWLVKAKTLRGTGDDDAAHAAARRALELRPHDPRIQRFLAEMGHGQPG